MNKIKALGRSQRYDAIATVFCIAILIIALVVGSFRQVGTFGVESDFYQTYAVQAENILAGRPYTYQLNPPGYCILLAVVTSLTGDTFIAGKVISAFAAALFGWITYLLLKILFNPQIALVTTILSLLTLIPSSFIAATDLVSAAIVMLCLWIFLRQPHLTFNICFISGAIAGIAYLFRGNAIFVSVSIIFSLIFINQEPLSKRISRVSIFICGLFLTTLPWFIYNWQINGGPFTSSAYLQVAAHFYHPQDDEFITALTEMSLKFDSLSQVLLYKPRELAARYFQDVLFLNIPKLFIPQSLLKTIDFPGYQLIIAGPLTLVSLGLILLIIDISKNQNKLSQKRLTFLLVNTAGYLLLGLVGFHRRYYIFLFPLIFLLITYPILRKHVPTSNYKHYSKLVVKYTFIIILAFALAGAAYLETKLIIVSEPRYLLEVADFLKDYSSANEVIITRKPHLAYLSGLKDTFPLANTAQEYLEKAREVEARYIVYSDYEATLWQGLKALRDAKALPKNFKLIYSHQPTNTLIYEINFIFSNMSIN